MTDDDLHLLTAGYALDSLDEHERARFENMKQSDETMREVTEMRDTAMLLGLATRPVAPSPELRANLLSLIASTPQLAPLDPGSTDAAPHSTPAAPRSPAPMPVAPQPTLPEASASTRAEAKAAARWYARPVNAIVAAAAAVALIAGGALFGTGSRAGDDAQLAQADVLAQLVAAEDVQQTVAAVAGGGEVTLLRSDDLKRSAVAVDDLPELAAGSTYQLWYIDEAGATSAGTFDATSAGTSWRVLDGSADGDASIGMTVEPSGGSETPTTKPLVVIAA